MRRKNCVLLPAAGRRTQFFLLIFTKPGRSLLAEPCRFLTLSLALILTYSVSDPIDRPDADPPLLVSLSLSLSVPLSPLLMSIVLLGELRPQLFVSKPPRRLPLSLFPRDDATASKGERRKNVRKQTATAAICALRPAAHDNLLCPT